MIYVLFGVPVVMLPTCRSAPIEGGLLPATRDARRPTRDGDLGWVTEIARHEVDDG